MEKAAQRVTAGSMYAHYKHPDQRYKVMGLVILEATDEPGVIYQAQYGNNISFVRPLASWLETVLHNGKHVARFTKVG